MSTARPSILAAFFVIITFTAAAELPVSYRKAIDKALDDYAKSCSTAEEKLAKSFDTVMEQLRKNPQTAPELRQSQIEDLSADKTSFLKTGTIPFSAPMRTAVNQYLSAIDKSRSQVSKEYDKAIDHLQRKVKDDGEASTLIEEKKKALTPRIVGVWDCTGTSWKSNFTWNLYSNGTFNERSDYTWRIEGDKLVLRYPGFVDTCQIAANGKTMKAANQKDATYIGRLVPVTKQ